MSFRVELDETQARAKEAAAASHRPCAACAKAGLGARGGCGAHAGEWAFRRLSPWDRWVLLWGGPRRWMLRRFRPGYVRRSLAARRGECHRCGACCHMSWHCSHLRYEDGLSGCAVYQARPAICDDFPVDRRDLEYVKRAAPGVVCGYYWE